MSNSWSRSVIVAGSGLDYDGANLDLASDYKDLLDNAGSANGVVVSDGSNVIIGNYIPTRDTYANLVSGSYVGEAAGQLLSISDNDILRICDGATVAGLDFVLNSPSAVFVQPQNTESQSGAALAAAYARAAALTPYDSPLSATNRARVIVGPGRYRMASDFAQNADYVDIISIAGSDHTFLDFASDNTRWRFTKGNHRVQGFTVECGGLTHEWVTAGLSNVHHKDMYWYHATPGTAIYSAGLTPTTSSVFEDIRTNGSNCYGSSSSDVSTNSYIRCRTALGVDCNNCFGGTSNPFSFSNSGKYIDCRIRGQMMINPTLVLGCEFSAKAGQTQDILRALAGTVIANSHFYHTGSADCIGAAGALSASIFNCTINPGSSATDEPGIDNNITNSISSPQNINSTSLPQEMKKFAWL